MSAAAGTRDAALRATAHERRNAIILIAFGLAFSRVNGQIADERRQNAPPQPCPAPAALSASDLWGLWRVQFDGLPPATLLLERHATREASVYGEISRAGVRALLAGDIEAGELVLDESDDGRRISAVWVARPVAGQCGRQWQGQWRAAGSPQQVPFVMQRVGDL